MTDHPDSPESAGSRPLTATFGRDGLAAVRRSVSAYARHNGLREEAVDGFVLAVNEIASNAIAHGGGGGSLRLWVDGRSLRCRVSDHGPGVPTDRLDCGLPPLSASCGRGLWLAHQFCQVEIQTTGSGTTIELTISLNSADCPCGVTTRPTLGPSGASPGASLDAPRDGDDPVDDGLDQLPTGQPVST